MYGASRSSPTPPAPRTSAFWCLDHWSVRNGASAFWRSDSSGLGITRSGSTPGTRPNPWHAGQAPSGLLNENSWAVGSSNVIPSRSNKAEKSSRSDGPSFGAVITTARSPPSRNACSTESAIRLVVCSLAGAVASRSTSTSRRVAGVLTSAGGVSLRSMTSGWAPFSACLAVGSATTRKKPRASSASSSWAFLAPLWSGNGKHR